VPPPSLILFARVPAPGRVKTRLLPHLTADGAADLYRAFLEDAARVYLQAARWSPVLCAEPDAEDPSLAALFPKPWRRRAQAQGDLGRRLTDAFEREFRRGAPAAVAVGSDHPALPLRRLEEVFDSLNGGHRAALIPAEDGGYCAIGLAADVPLTDVFHAIPWSTDAVLEQTVRRLVEAGVAHRVLGAAYDVDRPEDLDRLRRDLRERDASARDYPRATARTLAALDAKAAMTGVLRRT
jgi:rSAM/selenodomain-associated transferase 1